MHIPLVGFSLLLAFQPHSSLSQHTVLAATHEPTYSASGPYELIFPRMDALPNHRLTPGALNPAITPATMSSTICRRKSGYTKTIRPKESYTERLKRDGIRAYNYPRQLGQEAYRLGEYEEDHLIPLELGGSPDSPKNLWPEQHHVAGGWGSRAKDQLENRLHFLVCSGRLTLSQAQGLIARNWIAAYKTYVGPHPGRRLRHAQQTATAPASNLAPHGPIKFPSGIFPEFADETAGRARMHTCAKQYDRNKLDDENGGLKWTVRGGGYYHLCNLRLKEKQ